MRHIKGDSWVRHIQLESGLVYSVPIQDLVQQENNLLLAATGHGLTDWGRVAVLGVNLPGLLASGPSLQLRDYRLVQVLDDTWLSFTGYRIAHLPPIGEGARAYCRPSIPLQGIQATVLFQHAGELVYAQEALLQQGKLLINLAGSQTRTWPTGVMSCAVRLRWPDGRVKTLALHSMDVEEGELNEFT